MRLKEGGHINRSLLTLSTVIGKLSQLPCNGSAAQASASSAPPAPLPHIPYRDSVLTRILEPALGGNSRTALIACINEVPNTTHRLTKPSAAVRSRREKALTLMSALSLCPSECAARG